MKPETTFERSEEDKKAIIAWVDDRCHNPEFWNHDADYTSAVKEAKKAIALAELPLSYRDGMPNANCDGCVKATSPTYWNLIRVKRAKAFQERAEQSRRLGVRLVRYKGKRIFLDELPADAKGRPIKDMNFECGIFCELTN